MSNAHLVLTVTCAALLPVLVARADAPAAERAREAGRAAQQTTRDKLDEAKEKLEEAKADAKAKLEEAKAGAKAKLEEVKAAAAETRAQVQEVAEQARAATEAARQEAKDATKDARESVRAAAEAAREHVEHAEKHAVDALEHAKTEVAGQAKQGIERALDALPESAAAQARRRRQDALAELAPHVARGKDIPPEVSAALRAHALRTARLLRIRALAEAASDADSVARADKLLALERARHHEKLARFWRTRAAQAARGRSGDGQPEGEDDEEAP